MKPYNNESRLSIECSPNKNLQNSARKLVPIGYQKQQKDDFDEIKQQILNIEFDQNENESLIQEIQDLKESTGLLLKN